MRSVVTILSVVGIVSGFAFALGPWILGVPGPSPAFWLMPALVGLAVAVVHWFNLKRVRRRSPHTAVAGALAANLALLLFFSIGALWLYGRNSTFPMFPLVAVVYSLSLLVPFVANAVYVVVGRSTAAT
jgi:hypothetical protein